jgi:hypothetical protein
MPSFAVKGAGQRVGPLNDLGGREIKEIDHLGKTKHLAASFGRLDETKDPGATRTGTARS